MCILFMYNGTNVEDSDYSLIVATNRDEFYNRPSQNMHRWHEDPSVIGGCENIVTYNHDQNVSQGRDLEPNCGNGTWLAICPSRHKLGVLLNLPILDVPNPKSRGKLVSEYVTSDKQTKDYIDEIKSYTNQCNGFIFVSAEFGAGMSTVYTYTNATDKLASYSDVHLAFGNSLPDTPLHKVEKGKKKMKDICDGLNKVAMEHELIEKLTELLKCGERNLPDPQLEKRQPKFFQELSSNFVCVPKARYGTRTHTIVLVTKKGHITILELTMQSPINLDNVQWDKTEFHFDINMDSKL